MSKPHNGRKSRRGSGKVAFKPALSREARVIKELAKEEDRPLASITIYSDAACKGVADVQQGDLLPFCGYGYYFVIKHADGREEDYRNYNDMEPADSHIAELKAVVEALREVKYPAEINLVTDSLSVYEGLQGLESRVKAARWLDSKTDEERTPGERNMYRLFSLWREINEVIQANKNIASLHAQWVRSHQLDNEHEVETLGVEQGRMLTHLIGNKVADREANMGAAKAVRRAVWNFVRAKGAEKERLGKSLSESLSTSLFAQRAVAKLCLDRPGLLSEDEIDRLIQDERILKKIESEMQEEVTYAP